MSSNCLDKHTILNDPNCKSPYVDAVNAYISQMNKYCLDDNRIIQDSYCVDFINYEYLNNTPLQHNLLKQATLACQKNTDPILNDICINKFKYIPVTDPTMTFDSTTPTIENKDMTSLSTTEWIIIGAVLFFLVIIVVGILIYRRQKNNVNKLDILQSKVSTPPLQPIIV